jgi:SacI homology domain
VGAIWVKPARKHFSELNALGYRKQISVNLVHERGRARPVKLAYDDLMNSLDLEGLKYVYFDFHAAQRIRWDRLSCFIDHLKETWDERISPLIPSWYHSS